HPALQPFPTRRSSDLRQATSRLKQIDRIKSSTVEVKPSSRVHPYIRFEQNKVLHRLAVTVENLSKGYDGHQVINDFSMTVEAGRSEEHTSELQSRENL